ncbi:MFS transporter [Anaerolineales bacterium]
MQSVRDWNPSIGLNRFLGLLSFAHGINDYYTVMLSALLPFIAAEFTLSYTESGMLVLLSTLFSALLQPVMGYAADRFGWQKAILIGGFAIFGLGTILIGISFSTLTLMLAAIVYGLGRVSYHPQATRYITRAYGRNAGRAMGVHGFGGSAGMVVAPLMVTGLILLIGIGWREASFVLALPALFAMLILSTILTREKPAKHPMALGHIGPQLLMVTFIFSLIVGFNGIVTNFVPLYLNDSNVIAILMGASLIFQVIGGWLFDRFGRPALTFGCIITMVGWAMFLLIGEGGFVPALALVGGGIAATFPVALTIASRLNPNNIGLTVGIVFGASSALGSLSPLLFGSLADAYTIENAFALIVSIPILASLLSLTLWRKRPVISDDLPLS